MKQILGAIIVTVVSSIALAEHQKIEVGVKGMVCDFCAQGISKQFKKMDAVEKIDVNLDKKIVVIQLKHGQKLEDEKVKTSLKDAGYDVTYIKQEG